MDRQRLRELLEAVREGRLGVDEAVERLRVLPFEDLGFAKIDHHRALRRGFPEVIYCAGKTPEQVAQIATRLAESADVVLATRATPEHYEAVHNALPDAKYLEIARIITCGQPARTYDVGVAVLCAGTSDMPVAEEARVTIEATGCQARPFYDVGVAGLHRLLQYREDIEAAEALVVVAGMEGALPSVVAGLFSRPVIAVPTSIGYGASFGGIAALLSMLNSCASGVAVVNIDNGFGAGYLAALIARRIAEAREGYP
ncbi:MAG: nickel pincer cofactor biosynthesis protein LarB [Armatimonadetes bacterium]|nr:nickel pincer cofactor biosynthesis protein LarB [Armatimonadota bacterium]